MRQEEEEGPGIRMVGEELHKMTGCDFVGIIQLTVKGNCDTFYIKIKRLSI